MAVETDTDRGIDRSVRDLPVPDFDDDRIDEDRGDLVDSAHWRSISQADHSPPTTGRATAYGQTLGAVRSVSGSDHLPAAHHPRLRPDRQDLSDHLPDIFRVALDADHLLK